MQLEETDRISMSCYFVDYLEVKRYRFFCTFWYTKIFDSITTKFFKNGDFSASTKLRKFVFEEEKRTMTVPIVLNRTNVPVEPKPFVIPNNPIFNQHVEPNIEMCLRRL